MRARVRRHCGPRRVTNDSGAAPRGPTIVKAFGQSTIVAGGITTLTVTLTAPAATCTPAPAGAVFTNAGFTDLLPAGMTLASPALVSNTCGGAVTATPGATRFGLAGAGIAPASSCSVTVNVTATAPGGTTNTIPRDGGNASTAGFFNDQTAAAVADASATLVVAATPVAPANIPALSRELLALLAVLVAALALRRAR